MRRFCRDWRVLRWNDLILFDLSLFLFPDFYLSFRLQTGWRLFKEGWILIPYLAMK